MSLESPRGQQVSLLALDGEHPAQLAGEISVFASRKDAVESLLVGLSGRVRPSCRLSEFLLGGKIGKARLDPTDGVDEARRPRAAQA